jgi:nitroreductase
VLLRRFSCRQFDSARPVPPALIRRCVLLASRAPSGGNTQPWHVRLLTGDALRQLSRQIHQRGVYLETAADRLPFKMYPDVSASRAMYDRRVSVAKSMYALAGIAMDDKAARNRQSLRNYDAFDAPALLFICVDAAVDRNGWAHCGMFAMALALACEAHGLATCFQESFANIPQLVGEYIGLPSSEVLWCALSIGFADRSAPINRIRTERRPVDDILSIPFPSAKM